MVTGIGVIDMCVAQMSTLAMGDGVRVAVQVVASLGLLFAVLFVMWKLPLSGDRFYGWGPPLAISSAWSGLAACGLSVLMWVMPSPDTWVVWAMLVVDPASLCTGILVLWIYRKYGDGEETVLNQITQAKVGIMLGLIAVAIGYWFVMTHKMPFTPVGS
jgi:hypothetical protein